MTAQHMPQHLVQPSSGLQELTQMMTNTDYNERSL